jgi:murein DD-endopeptidase MepM/ murein hydrolase activator NlpD
MTPARTPAITSATILRGVVLVLTLLLVVCAPARALAADPDPIGVWPLVPEPEVVAGFDPPESRWGAGHRGVDLLGSPGQPVRSALPGRVTYAGLLAGRGVVVVDHGTTRTTYEPVHATVPIGTTVTSGQRIGRLELTGSHCLPRACLHWGWIRGETYLDPLRLVGAGPVRLLPLWRDRPVGSSATTSAQIPSRPAPASPYAAWRSPMGLLLGGLLGSGPPGVIR